jgi:hypothetical protein
LVEKYSKKGFVVVGVTSEPKSPTIKFIEDTGWKATVVIEKNNATMRAYAFKGYPSAALVSPDGKVVWTGHPSTLRDKDIEKNLVGVRMNDKRAGTLYVDAELPGKYKNIAKKLASGKLGDGLKALQGALKKCSQNDKASLEDAVQAVEKLAEDELAKAEQAGEEGRWFDAQTAWKRLAKHYPGHEAGKTAKGKLQELKKDKSLKPELEAGKRIAKAKKQIADKKVGQAKQTLNRTRGRPAREDLRLVS